MGRKWRRLDFGFQCSANLQDSLSQDRANDTDRESVTAVAIWPENNQLWIVADTRTKGDVLTDAASKIYGLTVICRPRNSIGTHHYPEPYFQGTFGAAFRGQRLRCYSDYRDGSLVLGTVGGVGDHGRPVSGGHC
jgi:hypothetical protein